MEVEQANKKKEKTERSRRKKINLVKTTAASDALLSPVASTHHFSLSFIMSPGSAGDVATSDAPSSLIVGGSSSSAVSGCFSSFITGGGLLSIVSGFLLSSITGDGLLSIVSGCFCLLLLVVVFCLLFLVIVLCLLCLLLASKHYF